MRNLPSTSFLYGWKDPIFIFIVFSFTAFERSCLLKFNFVDYLFFGGVYDMCIDIRINCRFSTCSRSTIKIVFITYLSNYVPSMIENLNFFWDTRKCSMFFCWISHLRNFPQSLIFHDIQWKIVSEEKKKF